MNKGFETEAIARQKAAADFPTRRVVIIQSQGQYYVEPEPIGMLRSWESVRFEGLGKHAEKPKVAR